MSSLQAEGHSFSQFCLEVGFRTTLLFGCFLLIPVCVFRDSPSPACCIHCTASMASPSLSRFVSCTHSNTHKANFSWHKGRPGICFLCRAQRPPSPAFHLKMSVLRPVSFRADTRTGRHGAEEPCDDNRPRGDPPIWLDAVLLLDTFWACMGTDSTSMRVTARGSHSRGRTASEDGHAESRSPSH